MNFLPVGPEKVGHMVAVSFPGSRRNHCKLRPGSNKTIHLWRQSKHWTKGSFTCRLGPRRKITVSILNLPFKNDFSRVPGGYADRKKI